MSCPLPARPPEAQRQSVAARGARRGGWQFWCALFAALSFFLLVSTAATHTHASALSAHDCALCTAVADKVADTPAPPALVHVLQLQPYLLFCIVAYVAAYVSRKLLPAGRGPPNDPV
jgi:hypothetical protein